MSRRDNWEPEDGMGFAGLVPTAAEKSAERHEERQRQQMQELRDSLASAQREVAELRERLNGLVVAVNARKHMYGDLTESEEEALRAALTTTAQGEK